MVARQRPEWTAVEIASHALQATSLSQLTLPEVKRLAAQVLRDEGSSPEPNAAEPKPSRAAVLYDKATKQDQAPGAVAPSVQHNCRRQSASSSRRVADD